MCMAEADRETDGRTDGSLHRLMPLHLQRRGGGMHHNIGYRQLQPGDKDCEHYCYIVELKHGVVDKAIDYLWWQPSTVDADWGHIRAFAPILRDNTLNECLTEALLFFADSIVSFRLLITFISIGVQQAYSPSRMLGNALDIIATYLHNFYVQKRILSFPRPHILKTGPRYILLVNKSILQLSAVYKLS